MNSSGSESQFKGSSGITLKLILPYFPESKAPAMGSRMNPECKIYIGGLPDDANKSDTHLMFYPFSFSFPISEEHPHKMTPTLSWILWIMTITLQPDPTLIFLHKPSHSQPLNSNAKKSNASKLRCNYKATHRVASLHLALLNLSKNLVKAKKAHHHHPDCLRRADRPWSPNASNLQVSLLFV